MIKAGAIQTEAPLLKQYVAGERMDLLDDEKRGAENPPKRDSGQPGVARAFALRGKVCRFTPQALLSFLASRSINPEVNTLPYGENLLFVELA